MPSLALSALIGSPVYDRSGAAAGKVREVAAVPQDNSSQILGLVVRTGSGDRLLVTNSLSSINGGARATTAVSDWMPYTNGEGMLLLARDLLDQQIIDVHGRKVVRVNDVELYQDAGNRHPVLRVGSVDVGARGAVRRLLKGVVPIAALRALLRQIPERPIPWEFVDLIETDPARRVKLKISHERLARLHPADIADIVEDLAPAEREAVFEKLDVEEVEPRVQKSIMESLDSERAAEIVEEMNPDAAADLLADLTDEHSSEILQEMAPQERQVVADILEF